VSATKEQSRQLHVFSYSIIAIKMHSSRCDESTLGCIGECQAVLVVLLESDIQHSLGRVRGAIVGSCCRREDQCIPANCKSIDPLCKYLQRSGTNVRIDPK